MRRMRDVALPENMPLVAEGPSLQSSSTFYLPQAHYGFVNRYFAARLPGILLSVSSIPSLDHY